MLVALAWMAQSDQAGVLFGEPASAGDVNGDGFDDVLAGANAWDLGQLDEGAFVLYLGSPTGPGTTPDLRVESDQPGARLGRARPAGDVNGDGFGDVVASAPSWNGGEGAAFVHLGSAAGLSPRPAWTTQPAGADLAFATGAGDVNGDGFDDVIAAGDAEVALLYLGSRSGLAHTPAWTLRGGAELDFAWIVGRAGDVNGDGRGDVLIASRLTADTAGVAVLLGTSSGLEPTPSWTAVGRRGEDFGWSAAAAGDVNGDGYDDLAIGAPSASDGEPNEGAVYVYLGSRVGLAAAPAWQVTSDQPFADLGWSVASAGDVDADGRDDLLVGVSGWDGACRNEGQVRLYRGSVTGLERAPAWRIGSGQEDAYLGSSVAPAGDVDGDGRDDVLAGAWRWDGGEPDEGAVFLYGSWRP